MTDSNHKLRGRQWRVLAAKFRKRCEAEQACCWLCDNVIDYTAKPQTPNAFEADHLHPVSTHPHLAFVMSNLRPAHSSCNRRRGNAPALTGTWIRATW